MTISAYDPAYREATLEDMLAVMPPVYRAAPELLTALEGLLPYLTPVLRSHPVGAPGSPARIEQETRIEVEDRARTAIAKARKGE